jgi:hypothetical protein
VSKTKSQDNLHQVTLLRDHEHEGKPHRASETIEVSTPVRNWLLAQYVIAPEPTPTTSTGDI